jgi:enterochelin esterase-like enzyme
MKHQGGFMSKSQIIQPIYKSSALENNPLGDPSSRPIQIYLPPGYEDTRDPYPTAYLLAGFAGRGFSFMNTLPWEENIQERLDRLIESGDCNPLIVVMPDCFTRYGGSQYLDSSATGNYRSYLHEIVGYVDQQFRTIPDRDHRAILGKSSGGYGALMAAIQHPDVFGLVADHSGDKFFEKCYAKDLLELPNLLTKFELSSILEDPFSIWPKSSDFFHLMSNAAMSACYSPNPDSKFGFDWPVDTHTGALIPEVWERWTAKDPVHILDAYEEAFASLNLLFFDCGNHDEYYMHLGCRYMAQQLHQRKIPHVYEEFAGGHRHTNLRYDRSFTLISRTMVA